MGYKNNSRLMHILIQLARTLRMRFIIQNGIFKNVYMLECTQDSSILFNQRISYIYYFLHLSNISFKISFKNIRICACKK